MHHSEFDAIPKLNTIHQILFIQLSSVAEPNQNLVFNFMPLPNSIELNPWSSSQTTPLWENS